MSSPGGYPTAGSCWRSGRAPDVGRRFSLRVRRGSCSRAVGSGTSVGLELPAISLDFLVAVGYTVGVAWEINATKQAETWLLEIDQDAFEQIAAAIDELEVA